GGVFSCVADLARWVIGFAGAFPPGEPDAGGAHPLARATRREMQLPQVAVVPPVLARLPGDPLRGGPLSYGLGLFVEEDRARGRVASHSGGYPGFGSNMRWHPETGTGVIVLANSTYAPAHSLAVGLLDAALQRRQPAPAAARRRGANERAAVGDPAAPAGAPGSPRPWPAALAAPREANQRLYRWSNGRAHRLVSEDAAPA